MAAASLALTASLAAFFASYTTVFAYPAALQPLTTIPEGEPGHMAAELPASAGLAAYLVSTVLIVLPILVLHRASDAAGLVVVVTALVALPAAALSDGEFLVPAIGATVGALVADLVLRTVPVPFRRWPALVGGLVPLTVWTGQLAGLSISHHIGWSLELASGVVLLTALTGFTVATTSRYIGGCQPVMMP